MMLKVKPHPEYPPEEGRYLRGNDYSPAAVVIILTYDAEEIPPEIEKLVRTGVETGAALSGTLQTANIGIEKIICNIVANPNIRYLILGGPESEGHKTGDAIKALLKNGVDEKKFIIGTCGLTAVLHNVPAEFIKRFREQLTLVDCQFQDESVIRKAVWSCFQEKPVVFRGQSLFDPGAFPEPPLSGKLTWKVTQPWAEPGDDKERAAKQRAQEMIERLKTRQGKLHSHQED
jgi:tetrahydromethanopterin S-methyltransferase subunit A